MENSVALAASAVRRFSFVRFSCLNFEALFRFWSEFDISGILVLPQEVVISAC
jgi:hypothetical protein